MDEWTHNRTLYEYHLHYLFLLLLYVVDDYAPSRIFLSLCVRDAVGLFGATYVPYTFLVPLSGTYPTVMHYSDELVPLQRNYQDNLLWILGVV
ncbi:hypothetical protein BDY19DRAFT_107566 [Irpex rosettiformis]|uniref:Uncharacterized protein n=1 Tax=Irpex rosettiformis TaxID=378272 RepID=A0ACB8U546_9APHY|nr:hypothetical protein BDY19DRAFT_107566 [Irpex rosettiformis]